MKPIQIFYQLKYRLVNVKPLTAYIKKEANVTVSNIFFSDFLPVATVATTAGCFQFINQKKCFGNQIDWQFMEYGKLWNYNLHYGNYLLQEDIPLALRLSWLSSLHSELKKSAQGLEPYPVSLRLINTIRLVNKHTIQDEELLQNIKAEARFLSTRLEYHILGNHLLENAFALYLAGAFFKEKEWVAAGEKILQKQLTEQLLEDGGHFELSPMYHQIILYRLLELIDWYTKWESKTEQQLAYYRDRAGKMLSWLQQITFTDDSIPLLNDSATGIAYTSQQLFAYAASLNVATNHIPLSDSGYRRFNSFSNTSYECVVDIGNIAANYQPGHTHADIFSFWLNVNHKPVLVERGTSTYQTGAQRDTERSSGAHNTLVYKNQNQSQVWGGFRVAKRALVNILSDEKASIAASHNGYAKYGCLHHRSFEFKTENIIIEDSLKLNHFASGDAIVYFHVHPDRKAVLDKNRVLIDDDITLIMEGNLVLEVDNYEFAHAYNSYNKGVLIKVRMNEPLLKTIIQFN